MANLIQVKRSTTNAAPASLNAGELAYSFLNTSNSLFVGNTTTGGPIRIGGGNYIYLHQSNTATPGALTANAVVIVNGNSFVSGWKTNSLTVGVDGETTAITNISSFANTTQLGGSANGANTELVTSWAVKTFIDNNAARLPNTYVAFGANSVANGGSEAFTFDSTSNTLAIGNSSVNTTVNSSTVSVGTVLTPNVKSAGDLFFLSGAGAYGMQLKGSNGILELSATGQIVGGPYGGSKLELSTGVTSLRAVRDGNITLEVGTNDTVTSTWTFSNTGIFTAPNNVVVTGVTNAASFNSTGTATSTFANNVTINGVANVTGFNSTGAVTSTFANNITVTGVTNTSSLNVSGLLASGDTTVTGFVNVSSYGTFGGTVNAAALNVSGVTSSGNATVTGFVNVSSYGRFGGAVNAASLNISGLTATGNVTVTGFVNSSSYGTFGGVVNATSFNSTGTATSTFANNVTVTGVVNATSINTGDLSVTGNLTVSGTLTTVNANNLTVSDSLIQVAVNNNITPDILDIGLYGNFGIDGVSGNHVHTGLFRDASDGIWKLFTDLAAAPTTTIDTSNATFTYATLKTHLQSGGSGAGGLIANATTIAITANSTLNVAIVANTLTLSSPLEGTSGGTGLSSFTAEDILVANSTNGFRKLSVGTEGYILQVASGVVAWNTLDGGSF